MAETSPLPSSPLSPHSDTLQRQTRNLPISIPQPRQPFMSDFPMTDPPPPPPPSRISTISNANGSPGPPPGAISEVRGRRVTPNTSNLKPYQWLKLTRAAQDNLCNEPPRSSENGIDLSELERLFSVASSPSRTTSRKAKPKVERVQLIDTRRAYICEIMLSKVTVPLPELVNLALVMDDSRLDLAQVDNLIKFCPTKAEKEALQNYKGDVNRLGKCEQFFLELMKVPRMEAKLRVFSYKTKFTAMAFDLRNSLTIVNSAANEIRHSTNLKMVLKTILSLGNALNPGSAKDHAIGFRLASLHKLTGIRSRNAKMTLMHYLCKVIAEQLPAVIDFPKDLVSLEAASKIELEVLAADIQAITEEMERAEKEWTNSHDDGPVSAEFCKVLQVFLGYAEPEVKSLTSLYFIVGKNVNALPLYFAEDPTRCPFKQVLSTLLSFARAFTRAHEENLKLFELDMRKAERESDLSQMMIESNKKLCTDTESPSSHGQ